MSARIRFSRVGLAALAGLSGSCNSSEPPAAPAAAPLSAQVARPTAPAKPVAPPPAPVNPVAAAVAPRKEVPWKTPRGAPTRAETPLVGTWVATVGDYATRTAFMADKIRPAPTAGGPLAAMRKDDQGKTNCIWLELTRDHKGVRRECALVSGKPTPISLTNPITGEKSTSETRFEWYFDAAPKVLHARFDADVFVPAVDEKSGATQLLRFREWTLALGRNAQNGIEVQESIPEHDYALPARYLYEVFSGHFVGDKGEAIAK